MTSIDNLLEMSYSYNNTLLEIKKKLEAESFWYPYVTLTAFIHLNKLLKNQYRDLSFLSGNKPIVDIGGGDGDIAFFLESHGFEVDVIEYGPTNYNGLRGLKRLKTHLGSSVEIHEIDLDTQFSLPRGKEKYGLVLFLGVLYHLKNPYYILETLAKKADYAIVSTRIAQMTVDRSIVFDKVPVAYLVAPDEVNNDSTNYWIFSDAGLRRILDRTGWNIIDYIRLGSTKDSDPSSPNRDERVFCLLRSKFS